MDFREVGRGAMVGIHMAENRDRCMVLMDMVMNLRVP